MRKVLALISAMIICLVGISNVYADGLPIGIPSSATNGTNEFTITENSMSCADADYITDEDLTITVYSGGSIKVSVYAETAQTMQKLGFTSLVLEHWNGSEWENASEVTNQFSLNTTDFFYNRYFTGLQSGHHYRVTVKLYAKKGFLQVQKMTITSNYFQIL